jgi:hypothetical protein
LHVHRDQRAVLILPFDVATVLQRTRYSDTIAEVGVALLSSTAARTPDDHALAATMFLGRPQHRPTRLTRRAGAEFTTVDRFDCGTFEPDAQA